MTCPELQVAFALHTPSFPRWHVHVPVSGSTNAPSAWPSASHLVTIRPAGQATVACAFSELLDTLPVTVSSALQMAYLGAFQVE